MSKTKYVTAEITPLKYKSYEYFTRDMVEQRKEYRDAYLKALRESGLSADAPADDQAEIFESLNKLADKVFEIDHKARQSYIDDVKDKPERIYDDAMYMLKQIDIDYLVCDALMIWNYTPLTQKGRQADAKQIKASKNKIELLRQHFILTLYNSICYEQVEALDDAEAIFAKPFYDFFEELLEQAGGEDGLTDLINKYDLDPYDALIYNINFCSDMDDIFGSMMTGIEVKYPLSEYIKQTRGAGDTEAAGDKQTPIKKNRPFIPALIKSERLSLLNNKITNSYRTIQDSLFRIDANGQLTIVPEMVEVSVGTTGKRKAEEVITLVGLDYIGEETGKGAKLSAYDEYIYNIVISLYLDGNSFISLNSIFKRANGNTEKNPTKSQRDKYKHALTKINNHILSIDVSNEAKNGYLDETAMAEDDRIINYIINDRLLNFRTHKIMTSKGKITEYIELVTEPPQATLTRIRKHKQILTLPADMLNCEDVSITDDAQVLKFYLAKQAKLIATGTRNAKILLNTVYKECDLTPKDKGEAKRYRDTIVKIFDTWKKKGYIKGYITSKNGKSIDGFILKVNADAINIYPEPELIEG